MRMLSHLVRAAIVLALLLAVAVPASRLHGHSDYRTSDLAALTRALSDVRTQRIAVAAQLGQQPVGWFHRHPDGTLHFHPTDGIFDPVAQGQPAPTASTPLAAAAGILPALPQPAAGVAWQPPVALSGFRAGEPTPLPFQPEEPPPRLRS